MHAPVAQRTFPSQNVQSTPRSGHFRKLRCWKNAHRCGAKHMSKSKVQKNEEYGGLLDVQMSFFVAGAGDCAPCQKWAKNEGYVTVSKNEGRRGTFEEDLERCISRGRRRTRDTWGRCARRSGRRFPESGCILEDQVVSFGKMILRDRCSTSYDLASLFRGRRNTLETWSRQIAKRIGTRPSQLCTKFSKSLAEFFGFWCCQLQKLRKSRWIAGFLTLSSSKVEEVSQTRFGFDVVKFKNWGSLAE